ncbi:DUF1569 domain-containing protein [Ectopseudomonas mendocina]|uniref:DUF1569 domain-containing protein n=1 Tax=Ectopseudomonas mendocina TaxID=300 RepID=A0ABZ2RCF0_ECTME
MNRRQLLKWSVLSGVAVAGTGYWALPSGPRPATLSLEGAQSLLRELETKQLVSVKGWSPMEVFNHCAQSIEYSISGYPQMKPEWFRKTIGPLAFDVFAARGAMRHPLDEVIPGAAALDTPDSEAAALKRLQKAFADFAAHTGELKPHFAYGQLSRAEYAQAHVMHLYNHLSLLRPA